MAAADGDANDREDSLAGDHAGEVGGAASRGDDDFDSAGVRGVCEGDHASRGPVGGDDSAFEGDGESTQGLAGGDEHGEVGVGAHYDGDDGGGAVGEVLGNKRGSGGEDGVDERSREVFDLLHGASNDGNVSHFAAGTAGAFAVEVHGGAGDGQSRFREGEVAPGEVGVGGAEDVDHDCVGRGGGEGGSGGGDGEVEDGTEVNLELRSRAGVDSVVSRVVWAGS